MLKMICIACASGLFLLACATTPPGPRPSIRLAEPAAILDEASGPVFGIAWTGDGQRFVTAGKGEVRIWEPSLSRSVATWQGHSSYVCGVAWSPDQTKLATVGSDGVLILRDGMTGDLIRSFPVVRENEFWALAWSPDGTQIAVGTDHWEVLIYPIAGGEPVRHPAFGSSIQSLAWSPDGTILAVGDLNGVIALWSTKTWKLIRHMNVESERISFNTYGLAWSPDGKTLASAHDDGVVRLWRSDSDASLGQVRMTGPARCVTWSPDGRWIAAGGDGGTVILWDRLGPEASLTVSGSRDAVWSVAWSPDGKYLAAGNGIRQNGQRGQVLLWSVGQ